MKTLEGKIALVTGASKGIGAAIAMTFAAAGARVVVNYLQDEVGAADVVTDIQALGSDAIAVQADISREADVQRLFASSIEQFGAPEIVVNNAGIFHHGDFAELSLSEMQQQLNVNLLGTLLVCQQAAKHFPARGGSIINLSALNSQRCTPGSVLWAATKGAIDTLTQGLARELGPRNIRVNALAPGIILTEGLLAAKKMHPELKAQLIAATPLGRFGLPEDVAQVALFMASEESAYVSGERVLIAGGV
ncbi:3-oxoacyl-[acyl-carrier protein] reductase [Pantoea sp. AG1095]|uniref:SDR family NAD(P)-dependent oxidoreductase n=1 Tax=Pantoea sp. AG1095 TaxID=2184004 RepID=UPI000D901EFA|nr:glucose 1-dehydrogenase [Pantoea sp. AG1095]PYG46787.1 3-oxoacyl-[acyl-carrier protein] reductase [Pantoea sp. AG1095]